MACLRAQLILKRIRLSLVHLPFLISFFIALHLEYLSVRLLQLPTRNGRLRATPGRRSKEDIKKAYQDLSNVDKNSTQRVAFITFSYVTNGDTNKLLNFLLPAVDTWAAPVPGESINYGPMLYVVLSRQSRVPFETNCKAALCNRIQPVYVDCPEGYYGESPCCKQQKGMLAIFEGREYPLYDFYAYFDDDIYLRKEYIAQYLRSFEPNFPMALVPRNSDAKFIGLPPENVCSNVRGDNFMYPWGMPIFYSRGAMGLLARGFKANGLVKQCREFLVTHDIGNQIFNWMYSLRIAKMPPMTTLPKMRADFIGSHWVGRKDMEQNYHLQPRDHSRPKVEQLPKGSFSCKWEVY